VKHLRLGLALGIDARVDSNSHGARPVHQIISMIQWIRTSRLSVNNSLSGKHLRLGLALRIDARVDLGRYKATWKMEFKLPWRKAGPPNHLDDTVDSEQ